VRDEPASGLAIEARGRRQTVMPAALDPIIPTLHGRKRREALLHATVVGGMKAVLLHEMGGPCPARMKACPCSHSPTSASTAAAKSGASPPTNASSAGTTTPSTIDS